MYAALAVPPAVPARLSPIAARSRRVRERRCSSAPALAISRTGAFIRLDVAQDRAGAQATRPGSRICYEIRSNDRSMSLGWLSRRCFRVCTCSPSESAWAPYSCAAGSCARFAPAPTRGSSTSSSPPTSLGPRRRAVARHRPLARIRPRGEGGRLLSAEWGLLDQDGAFRLGRGARDLADADPHPLARPAPRRGAAPAMGPAGRLVLVDDLETALVVAIPFVAAAMARGLWLY